MKINDIKKEDNFSCIYLWKNLINGKVYVGQAQNFYKRMRGYINETGNHRLIKRAINKYGFDNFDIIVLERDIPYDKLNEREIYWIRYYNSCISFANSWGYNMTEGGDGSAGLKHTDETRRKLSDIRKNSGHPVVCVENGRTYKNAVEASKDIGASSPSSIRDCLNGKRITAGGYHWRYLDDVDWKPKIHGCLKPVLCIETGAEYKSIKEASRRTGINKCSISECCNGTQKRAGGFHWKFVGDDKWVMPEDSNPGNRKPVRHIETNIIYPTVKEAAKATGLSMTSVIECCKNRVKHVKHNTFEYI